ncbi:MAG TPA: glycyl-radical enzyme activating protein [Syntrophales bacterium]|nr:glycyl-radical enzyme activating protein [Syntrophales bacterium]
MVSGTIFNIQRFSVHDGPGIRTTVFFKGCPLNCPWCSNPESQERKPQLMIRDIRCVKCERCAAACPERAITCDRDTGRSIHWASCSQCLKCVEACLYDALTVVGRQTSVGEVLREVERDLPFYQNSGGGVTLSGGEPLMQPQFTRELLAALKSAGLHTALDTSGFAPEPGWEEILPFTDLLLFDVKHLDAERHVEVTGVDNGPILRNLRLAAGRTRIWLRVPLIRGFNDDAGHIRRLVGLAKDVRAEKISLLPYHEGGKTKCLQIGRSYPFAHAISFSDEECQELRERVQRQGVDATLNR